jgi:hypothetical protein
VKVGVDAARIRNRQRDTRHNISKLHRRLGEHGAATYAAARKWVGQIKSSESLARFEARDRRQPALRMFLVIWCALAVSLETISTPSQAAEQSDPVIEQLCSQTFQIPRNLIEDVYKLERRGYCPHEAVIRLLVQWPDFGPAVKTKDADVFIRRINISLSSLAAYPIMSVDDYVNGLQKRGLEARLSPAEYGLQELTSPLTKGFREYVAAVDDDLKIRIHCDLSCGTNIAWNDIRVNVYFSRTILPEWVDLLKRTKALLSAMKKV